MTGYVESLLADREKIILIARQHWFLLLSVIAFEIVIILILIAVTIIAGTYLPEFALFIGAAGATIHRQQSSRDPDIRNPQQECDRFLTREGHGRQNGAIRLRSLI
jgi:hypothetical protein